MSLSPSLESLYQDVILEHHAHPRGRGPLSGATHQVRRDNPLCGDRVTLQLLVEDPAGQGSPRAEEPARHGDSGRSGAAHEPIRRGGFAPADRALVLEAGFEGDGCALSIASASLLTSRLRNVTVADARLLGAALRSLLGRGPEHDGADRGLLGELVALEGTRLFPARIRCALLAWEALSVALGGR